MKFRRLPETIEAVQFMRYGDHPEVKAAYFTNNGKLRWMEGDPDLINIYGCRQGFCIKTSEDGYEVEIMDFIITGTNGEIYICKPDIFWKTYEQITDQGES